MIELIVRKDGGRSQANLLEHFLLLWLALTQSNSVKWERWECITDLCLTP